MARRLHDRELVGDLRPRACRQLELAQVALGCERIRAVDKSCVGFPERDLRHDRLDVRLLADDVLQHGRKAERSKGLPRVVAHRNSLRADHNAQPLLAEVVDGANAGLVRARDDQHELVRREHARLVDESSGIKLVRVLRTRRGEDVRRRALRNLERELVRPRKFVSGRSVDLREDAGERCRSEDRQLRGSQTPGHRSTITEVAFTTAVAVTPGFRPRASADSRVITETKRARSVASISICASSPSTLTSWTTPAIRLRALSACLLPPPRRRSTSLTGTARRFAASRSTRIRPCLSQRRSVSRLIPSARAASPAESVFATAAMLTHRRCLCSDVGSLRLPGCPYRAEITPVEPDLASTSEGSEMNTPQWGVEPVPERLRVLGTLDTFLLWTNLGISILVLVSAAYLGLSLKQAILATIVGALIGNTMLGVAALIGADARVPTMVLQRAPLGQRGSYLATGFNVLQCLGWAIFELIIIATAAAALSDRAFGFRALWMWKLLFGALATLLALLGPIGFVRRFVRKFAIWAVAASIVYLAWWIPAHGHLHRLWNEGGQGGSFFAGMDLVIALSVSWIPLVADYTRFSKSRRAAFWGAGLGYLFPTLFQFGFGAILVLSHPSIGAPGDVLTTVAAGGVASFLALLALTVDETDEAFANVYSTAMSLQNYVPHVSQRLLIVASSVIATVGALTFDLTAYAQFLYLLGAFFVPLFGVLLADWLRRGMHYTRDDVFAGPDVRPGMIFAWLCGFLLYEWLAQTSDLGFWTDFLGRLHPLHSQIGASLPSFALSFALASLVAALTRRGVFASAEA